MRSSDLSGVNKSLTTQNRHLQSTHIIKQMKQEAKASALQKKLCGGGGIGSIGVSSPKTKNSSISVSHYMMLKNDGDNNAFDEQDQLDEQYKKFIGMTQGGNMNTRTLSGPIVFSGQQNVQSNDCLLK